MKISVLFPVSLLVLISFVFLNPLGFSEATEIPKWVRTLSSWYDEGRISEDEFNMAISFLLKNKIIERESINSDIRVIYGIMGEQSQFKIISSSLDGIDKKTITNFDFNGVGQRIIFALDLKFSPNGKYFLYSFPNDNTGSTWLVDTETKETKLFVAKNDNQRLSEIFWSPDSRKITYSLWDIPPPCPSCGMPLYYINGPWYIYDVEKGTSEKTREKTRSLSTLGWWNNDSLLFSEFEFLRYEKIRLHLYDINSKISTPLTEINFLTAAIINQKDNTKLINSPLISDMCEILIIDLEKGIESMFLENNSTCPSNYNPNFWISDDGLKMIYGKAKSPSGGPISSKDRDDHGVYYIPSVYSMNLEKKSENPIFLGEPNGPYFILGGWNDKHNVLAYVEWQKKEIESYSLFISDSDGSSPVKIAETSVYAGPHHKEIPFYGWKFID